ncbi:MAG: hypothetical protein NZ701_09880, partial [Roseiflexus sp.]|nr:hypothetical protein [Roseiflexus sp.]
IDGAFHSVECDLAGEDYRRALDAYERRQIIRCTGDLDRAGERSILRHPRDVTILNSAFS